MNKQARYRFFHSLFVYKVLIYSIFFCSIVQLELLQGNEQDALLFHEVPASYKGRFRPLDVMARLWLEENYYKQSIKQDHYNAFYVAEPSALSFLWKIQFSGHQNWDETPLFWIYSVHLKRELGLPEKDNYFSYQQLSQAVKKKDAITQANSNNDISHLLQALAQFSALNGPYADGQKEFDTLYEDLMRRKIEPMHIAEYLEQIYPLSQRLAHAGTIFKVLPSKNGDWYSLNALTLKVYNREKNALEPIHNFTIYSKEQFEKIRNVYWKLIEDHEDEDTKSELAHLLMSNYSTIANKTIQKAWGKSLTYPSQQKLKMEYWYYQLPLIETSIAIYGVAILLLMIGFNQKKRRFSHVGTFLILVAFSLNSLILAIRWFVLGRPPVSNMFETVIYVPWIAVLTSLLLSIRIKNSILLIGASTVALGLLILLKVTGLGGNMENVQAVLDSPFWLMVHVLMVVGSYGVFALAGILGQIYLFQYIVHESETFHMQELGHAILQALYIGVALLIPGTILGGIWAAQSWGRFWDWDPKESWAFISSCVYLIFIHAYTFKHIRYFGLAMGSLLGLLAISFTWYGVNYILGSGLHSYGFGSGGEIYYYLFILIELLFLLSVGIFYWRNHLKNRLE